MTTKTTPNNDQELDSLEKIHKELSEWIYVDNVTITKKEQVDFIESTAQSFIDRITAIVRQQHWGEIEKFFDDLGYFHLHRNDYADDRLFLACEQFETEVISANRFQDIFITVGHKAKDTNKEQRGGEG